MGRVVALKVVSPLPFFEREESLWGQHSSERAHSLHYVVPEVKRGHPEIPSIFIDRYSKPGEIVLDPFCGRGRTLLEAAVLGRIPLGNDPDPLAIRCARAQLDPFDLTDVTLKLQQYPLSRPIEVTTYRKYFEPFYDPNTFREIINLKRCISQDGDPVALYVEYLALALLHGQNAGFFSAYTSSRTSFTPAQQRELNARRSQVPDYRQVAPRIIRKAAAASRDGFPAILRRSAAKSQLRVGDARDLGFLATSSVDLVVTRLPLPSPGKADEASWLRYWFAGVKLPDGGFYGHPLSREDWSHYINEVLVELARVIKQGRRAILDLDELSSGREGATSKDLVELVERDLGRFWEVEGIVANRPREEVLRARAKRAKGAAVVSLNKVVILRRR